MHRQTGHRPTVSNQTVVTNAGWKRIGVGLAVLAVVWLAVPAAPRAAQAQQNPPVPPPRPQGAPAAPQRDSAQQPQQSPAGTGYISGTVIAIATGQPLSAARVNLSGGVNGRTAVTDAQGHFEFTQLPAGRYNLNASRAHYLAASYGQTKPERAGTPIQLADGDQLKNLSLKMTRTSVITGTLLDDNGEGLMNVQVHAMRYTMRTGIRQLSQQGQGQTDDRGVYRIYDLPPGDYIVSATANNNVNVIGAANNLANLALEINLVRSAAAVGGAPAQSPAPQPPPAPAVVYAPTYFPGTTTAATAAPITIGPGEERAGIDFPIQRVTAAPVQGVVIGQVPQNLVLELVGDAAVNGTQLPPQTTRVTGPDGSFTFRAVPPGQYTITARSTAITASPNGPGASQPAMWGRAQVSTDGRPVTGVTISLEAGRSVSGHVVFDGVAKLPDLTHARITVSLAAGPSASAGPPVPVRSAQVNADLRFTITGITPGTYILRANAPGAGWSTKSSLVNGQDTLDIPIEITGEHDLSDAVVTFTDKISELTGTVRDASDKPAPDITIIVFPEDTRYWVPQSRRIQTAKPSTNGTYSVRNLPPGEYLIAAVMDVEQGGWYDPQFLRALQATSTHLSMAEGEKHTQDLRISGGIQ